jgi:hypothetical protein
MLQLLHLYFRRLLRKMLLQHIRPDQGQHALSYPTFIPYRMGENLAPAQRRTLLCSPHSC